MNRFLLSNRDIGVASGNRLDHGFHSARYGDNFKGLCSYVTNVSVTEEKMHPCPVRLCTEDLCWRSGVIHAEVRTFFNFFL